MKCLNLSESVRTTFHHILLKFIRRYIVPLNSKLCVISEQRNDSKYVNQYLSIVISNKIRACEQIQTKCKQLTKLVKVNSLNRFIYTKVKQRSLCPIVYYFEVSTTYENLTDKQSENEIIFIPTII